MAKRGSKPKKETKTPISGSVTGSPEALAGKIDESSPLVSEKPTTPEPKDESEGKGKRTRRTKAVREAEEQQAQLESARAFAMTIVDMKLGMLERFGGEIFKVVEGERDIQIAVYTKAFARLPEIPWYIELAVVETAFFTPRLIQLSMIKKQQKAQLEAEKKAAKQPGEDPPPVVLTTPAGGKGDPQFGGLPPRVATG